MANVIDSLKRLERAGSESSRATEKLNTAAATLATHLAELLPERELLPRGYVVRLAGDIRILASNASSSWDNEDYEDERWLNGNERRRDWSLAFAADIADGLLDDLAGWLEVREAESATATECLRAAAEIARQAGGFKC